MFYGINQKKTFETVEFVTVWQRKILALSSQNK